MTLSRRLTAALAEARDYPQIEGDNLSLSHDNALLVEAAVLVAITDRAEPGLILTQRPETMRKHPGQVAFPGGRVDPGDANIIAAALREAEEEISLPRDLVNVIGTVSPYLTITDYKVTPVIGIIPPDLALHPNDGEVVAIFEVPLSVALDERRWEIQQVEYQGQIREFYEMHWGDYRIWGATAAMIVNLGRLLQWTG